MPAHPELISSSEKHGKITYYIARCCLTSGAGSNNAFFLFSETGECESWLNNYAFCKYFFN